jgi:hypothetical protein
MDRLKHPATNIQQRRCFGRTSPAAALLDAGFLFLILILFGLPAAAEDFGDITVSAQSMYSGNTFHGYAETRVTLQNHSLTRTHLVTLVFPNNSWNSGNVINRLSRSVKLDPGARAVVPLLQPPLPAYGDGMMRVEISSDSGGPNLIRLPNANNHMNAGRGYGGSGSTAVALISRNLDYDAASRALNAGRGQFTAAMATGAADSGGRLGMAATAWMPDTSRPGATNWLELDYDPPLEAERILIFHTQPLPALGTVVLIGVSGTNLARFSMSGGATISSRRNQTEFTFTKTVEPVKIVRLEFGSYSPGDISIDAVELTGPSGNAWAADATASSDNSAAAPPYGSYSGAGWNTTESLRAEAPVSEWSDNWLAYTPFDAVALNAADLATAPPGVTSALGDYLSAGGNLIVFGKGAVPAAWRSAEKTSLPGGVEHQTGLGRCFVIPMDNLSQLDARTTRILRDAINSAARYWQTLPSDAGAANGLFPVVKNLKIPIRGIVIIMLAFVILIGPVNIILLNRRKRRTWMLWTIPAISFVTTLIVFAYSLLREGITPDTRIAGLTMLDQPNHHATTVGVTAFYCPLTPSGGLRFDYETEATPLIHAGYGGSGNRREVDWTQTQHFTHGWVSARVPAHFHLRKSETRRERIQLVNEDGKLQIVNGLGAPIPALWLADSHGNIYRAYNIAAGQKASLIPVGGTPVDLHEGQKVSVIPPAGSRISAQLGAAGLLHDYGFTLQNSEQLSLAGNATSAEKYLLPNTYIAELDGNPFIENALGSAASPKRTRTSAIVFGILDPTDTP